MPWQRTGDNAATYPPLMAVAGMRGAEECSLNEVAGFIWRCSAQSAGHMTDYNIDQGTVMMLSPTRWQQVTRLAVRAKLLTEHRVDGMRVWRLVEDPEFIHIRLRAAVEWDRQRDKDRRNPELTNPVLLRDGDACRYCGLVCNAPDHRGARGQTFDHREPGKPATVDTFVVACKGCNSKRLDAPDADSRHPLLPAPPTPYYSPKTAERLTAYFGRPILATTPRSGTQPAHAATSRSGTQPAHAPSDPAPSQIPHTAPPQETASASRPAPADTAPTRPRPGTQPDTAPRDPAPSRPTRTAATPARPDPVSDTAHPGWGGEAALPPPSWATEPMGYQRVLPGSGGGTRVGSGNGSRVGSGLASGASAPVRPSSSDPSSPPVRRSRRGRRSR